MIQQTRMVTLHVAAVCAGVLRDCGYRRAARMAARRIRPKRTREAQCWPLLRWSSPMPRCQSWQMCSAAQVMQQLDTAEAQAAAGEAAGAELSLVVDGRALGVLLADAAVKRRLLALGTRCAAVVCCRVSPLQKALVTRLVSAFHQGLGLIRAS